ncbi:hypothetical protein L6452_18626 [Arctium lappa]|uniref:Uncharacterized protein n=1 Tax=Arctium lappa TaxID=4217 RepID=A0ACB9C6R9_ARCLA|nr:hypothetical protein L6452_18626 [Arctium lappa]
MDSAKFAFQAQFYKSDLMMQLGTDTRPPVLINEDEFTQWQDRFINFIERQANGENMMKSLSEGPFIRPKNDTPLTADEIKHEKADREAKSNLMLALTNSIYNLIDCFKHDPNMMWTQLEKIMLGSSVIFDRFCTVINDLRKIKVEKTDLETNLKFLNALQPEWNKSCHRLRNEVRISTMQIQELYEILMTDESFVLENKAKLEKKNKKSVDPVALITSQLVEQALFDNAYNGTTDDEGEALQKAMILLSQHYQNKLQPRSGSNTPRFTFGSKVKVPEPKTAACYNCGKSGHISKEYRLKKIAQMCFLGDDQSDNDFDTDEDEFKFHWTSEKQVLEIENEKRTNNTHKEIPFAYTRENAKYIPEKSRRGRRVLNVISPVKSSMFDDFVDSYAPNSDKENISPIIYYSKKYTTPSDDYASSSSSDHCAYLSDIFSCASRVKSHTYFPIRTATNFHGPKFKLILSCLVSNICMTKLIKIIKVMGGDDKETKRSNVYLLIKIRSRFKIFFNFTCHLLFKLRSPQLLQVYLKEIQEMFEILLTDECIVSEKKAKLEKKKKSVDPIALLTSQLYEQALSENAYNGSTDDDGEALQKAMILLSQHYQKKFQPKSGSNSSYFTSGSKSKVPEPKTTVYYNYGKPGHISKECRAKKVRDSAYYRKKLELAEKRENGTALLAEEEFWLDHSDDEAANVEIAQMCFVGDDQSDDDSETDEDEDFEQVIKEDMES